MPVAALILLATQTSLLPTFPDRWTFLTPQAEKRDGNLIAQVGPAGTDGFSATGTRIPNPPIERELNFTVWLRAPEATTVELNAFAYDSAGKLLKPNSSPVHLQVGKWTQGHSTIVAPAKTAEIRLFVINTAAKPLDVSSPTLDLGVEKIVDLAGSGLLRASAGMPVAGGKGTVLFPVPGPTAESSPVSFVLRATPAAALKGYEIKRRDGDNWLCEARVEPTNGETVQLRWESLIAVHDLKPANLPKVEIEPVEANLRTWLAATPVVQATDPAIKKKAQELKAASPDLETFARNVIKFTSQNQGTGQPFVSLDASCAFVSGGSCTSRANLGAALFRAAGVPARTISHLPTFADGSALYEHWLVEYWHPGAGWTRVETTLGVFRPRATSFATLATSSVDDERQTGKPGQLGWIMPGAAWMSGIQGTGDLHPSDINLEASPNWCRPARRITVDDTLLKAARAAWPRLASGHPELEKMAISATPEQLTKALAGLP